MSRRHGLPPASPSLPHQVVRDTLSPCVAGTPPCCRISVPIAHFLLKTSSSRTNLTRSSSTNTCFNGPLLWDSEETRRTDLPVHLAEEPVYSGAPTSPRSEMHRLPFGGGDADPPACVCSHFRHTHSSVCLGCFLGVPEHWFQLYHRFVILLSGLYGPEDATTEITMCCLEGEGWPSTSHM
ncbi:hypothetical protein HID58_095788 [Brassica napus]|uniref:Uncharacterized protein n=1 Tax=Brassica napus TaxID=3708 RepID=A0ABQ7X2D6_BRANA|nr:hypothetical protein HID58_095788 [Brassica napus]